MQNYALPTQNQVRSDINKFVEYALSLEKQDDIPNAIQLWETILSVEAEPDIRAQANFHLAKIYETWNEVFAAQRFLGRAIQLNPADRKIRTEYDNLNRRISENQDVMIAERERKNTDQIISLFRIATGLKLLQMDKPVQAYPLMNSRTRIYPNAAVAMHLLTGIILTEDDKNSAIEFLEDRGWLANTAHNRYTITHDGLHAFYSELAKLHQDNEVYGEAAECCEQAYWLNNAALKPLYLKVVCEANSEAWEAGLAVLDRIASHIGESPETRSSEYPDGIDPVEYHTAAAKICASAYRTTQDNAIGLRAIAACEAALAIKKKNRPVSKLLKSLRSAGIATA